MACSPALNEEKIVAIMAKIANPPGGGQGLRLGLGDDCAIVESNEPLALTADMLLEGVHFSTAYMSFREIGHRAMAANLSDLAAMGASPAFALLSLGLPPAMEAGHIEQLGQGMMLLAARHNVALIGGDTVRAPQLTINLCLLGKLVCAPLLRSQAKVGHHIWVTGPLGLSAGGLFCLRHGLTVNHAFTSLINAHRQPTPRVEAGLVLARHGLEGALMDVSDGLSTDLARMCQASQVKGVLREASIPIAPELELLARENGLNPFSLALNGGEDFELLFTCPPAAEAGLIPLMRRQGLAPACLGYIEAGQGVWLERENGLEEISFSGFDHFKQG